VRAGDVVWNPLTGEKALVLESSEETAGARMVAELAVEEGGFVPGGDHVHDNSAEHFEVLEGRIAFVVDGKEQTLGAGERITVEPGGWHRWWNAGEGGAVEPEGGVHCPARGNPPPGGWSRRSQGGVTSTERDEKQRAGLSRPG
jgi:mannose-6-phosphate isomerase-like protein (cupin superfamily)